MALTKTDLKNIKELINESIQRNNNSLMIWMSQNFLTKDEGASKKDLLGLESRLNNKISIVQDTVVALDAKLTEITTFQQAEIQDIKVRIGLD